MANNLQVIDSDLVDFVFTDRRGGCSSSPYDSLNIGTHVGDDMGDVLRNRELLHRELSKNTKIISHNKWPFLNQTHEDNIVVINSKTVIDNQTPPRADAAITQMRNQPLVVMTADCGPLVIAGQSIVAVVHASWKTVSARIIDSVYTELCASAPGEIFNAILGPCIRPQSYEFAPELLETLASTLGEHVVSQTKDNKPAFDLPAAIKHECITRGIGFNDVNIDTYTSPNHFSYRRDHVTGRQGVLAWLK